MAVLLLLLAAPLQTGPTYRDLLDAVIDLGSLAAAPRPGEKALQFSSYDRTSEEGRDPEAWFANDDRGQFLRVERTLDSTEYVMADVDGPGVVTRIWSANPKGEILFYVDGAPKPALRLPFKRLLAGETAPFLKPLCGFQARGGNCFVPLPFRAHLKVAVTAADPYYQIDVRRFPAGTAIPSLSPELLESGTPALAALGRRLEEGLPLPAGAREERTGLQRLDSQNPLDFRLAGRGTVVELDVRLPGLPRLGESAPALLRGLRLRITADGAGRPQVDCPLGDFFGAAPDFLPYRSLSMEIDSDGLFTCRFPMPFRDGFEGRIASEGQGALAAEVVLHRVDEVAGPLRFHAGWRQVRDLPTRPRSDFRVLEATGPGRFVGCMLSIYNPVRTWWGEGDEKFFVDGESFPSTFGTGTEDYFGYAWSSPERFQHPFHNQTRCDGPGNFGYTSVNRFQIADAVPFQHSFRFELGVWHWKDVRVDYAATAWWYAPADGVGRFPSLPPVEERLPRPRNSWTPFRVAGALEGEDLKIVEVTRGEVRPQTMSRFGEDWSGDKQLWWTGGRPGDRLILEFSVPRTGNYRLETRLTRARDYGIVQLTLDGSPLGGPIDLYRDEVAPGEPVDLGTHLLRQGGHRLGLELQGADRRAEPAFMAGLDYLRLEPSN